MARNATRKTDGIVVLLVASWSGKIGLHRGVEWQGTTVRSSRRGNTGASWISIFCSIQL